MHWTVFSGSMHCTPEDLKAEYNSIQESLSRVQLPREIIVNKSTQGVGKDQKAAHTVVTTSAKYTETALKLALQLHEEKVGKEGLNQLIVVLFTQLKYLQDEGAALIVRSTFDPSVSKFFRTFQKNNSQFLPETIEILSKAVTIGAAQAQSQGHKGGNRGCGGGSSRGEYRSGNQRTIRKAVWGKKNAPQPEHY